MKITETELNISEILNVRKGRTPPRYVECKSRHSDCFVYVLTGQAEYTFGGRRCLAEAGNIIYLARGSRYSINIIHENYTYIYFDFLFNGAATLFENEIYKAKNLEGLENDFDRLLRLWAVGDLRISSTADRWCTRFILRLLRRVFPGMCQRTEGCRWKMLQNIWRKTLQTAV